MRRSRVAAFPVGLHSVLLLALCWLLLPAVFRPVERLLLGLACLPQQALALLTSAPAFAAALDESPRLAALRVDLEQRQWQADVADALDVMPRALEPLVCRVVRIDRLGGGGLPCEVLLDRSYAEVGGCADFVTKGEQLIGFLARPGIGTARDDRPEDPARVLLLHHPGSRPVAVAMQLDGGRSLRCIVEPAAVVDPAPLRTTLHEDPYLASRLHQSGGIVRTRRLEASWIGAVPGDLVVGTTRVWGYERAPGDVLTIGVYVDLLVEPRGLSQVVLWQTVPEAVPDEPEVPWSPARLTGLPDGTGGRFLLRAPGPVADGAAVAQDGICLGTARGIAFEQALVTSFAASRQPWALLLLPDDRSLPVQELWGSVEFADAGQAWFRCRRGAVPPGGAGFVFTGANGPGCPAGLLLGRAEPEIGRSLLRIVVPRPDPARGFAVASGIQR